MMHRVRRGSAIILVLIMTLALAGLAMSAIYMAGTSGLLSRYHDRERDLAFAVETALELGKSRLQRDTTLTLYDTGYKQLLTNQAVFDASGTVLTGTTVNLYGAYTGDTSGVYVPYITLLATVSDPAGLRIARRMDLYAQSFARYGLFTNDFPVSQSIGAGEIVSGRAHSNNRFAGSSSGSPAPAFFDTVSAAGIISGSGQWSDTVSATVIPYPAPSTNLTPYAATLLSKYQALSSAGNVSVAPSYSFWWASTSGGTNVSGTSCGGFFCFAITGSRLEFVSFDVNANGMIDSTEGFFRVFQQQLGMDTLRLVTDYDASSGTQVSRGTQTWVNQCGAGYTIGGRREFFPIAMHRVPWVQARIQSSSYPTVSAAQAAALGAGTRVAFRTIMQLPTARCFPMGSPYLMNVERYTASNACAPIYGGFATTIYTWGSTPYAPCAGQRYGGQDTTFTARIMTCVVDTTSTTAGACTGNPIEAGDWQAYPGTNNMPGSLDPVRQTAERPYLFPINTTYNPGYRGVIYSSNRLFVSGVVRGRATLYVNGVASLIDDLTYDSDPADSTNLCRNFFGLIARDSIMVSDNAINRPRVYGATTPGDTLVMGGNRDFIFHGIAMALGGSVSAYSPDDNIATAPPSTCPTGSGFNAAGGCLQVVGGTIMKTYQAPYNAGIANSGLRPLRERDPCQMENRRPPYFPIAKTRVRPYRSFDVDARQVATPALLTAYFTRLRGARAAP